MKLSNVMVGLGVVLSLGMGLFAINRPAEVKVVSSEQNLGALSSPDIASPYLSFGGVRRFAASAPLIQNASTTCSLLSPAATSTLVSGGIQFNTSSSSATIVELGKSVSPNATTTLIGTLYSIGAGAQATIQASTSPTGPAVVFAPNTYFNVKVGSAGTGNLPVGVCQATWEAYL